MRKKMRYRELQSWKLKARTKRCITRRAVTKLNNNRVHQTWSSVSYYRRRILNILEDILVPELLWSMMRRPEDSPIRRLEVHITSRVLSCRQWLFNPWLDTKEGCVRNAYLQVIWMWIRRSMQVVRVDTYVCTWYERGLGLETKPDHGLSWIDRSIWGSLSIDRKWKIVDSTW